MVAAFTSIHLPLSWWETSEKDAVKNEIDTCGKMMVMVIGKQLNQDDTGRETTNLHIFFYNMYRTFHIYLHIH